jgi:hypothetical protein
MKISLSMCLLCPQFAAKARRKTEYRTRDTGDKRVVISEFRFEI